MLQQMLYPAQSLSSCLSLRVPDSGGSHKRTSLFKACNMSEKVLMLFKEELVYRSTISFMKHIHRSAGERRKESTSMFMGPLRTGLKRLNLVLNTPLLQLVITEFKVQTVRRDRLRYLPYTFCPRRNSTYRLWPVPSIANGPKLRERCASSRVTHPA